MIQFSLSSELFLKDLLIQEYSFFSSLLVLSDPPRGTDAARGARGHPHPGEVLHARRQLVLGLILYIYIYIHVRITLCMYIYIYVHIYIYICMYVSLSLYIHIYIYIHISLYIYIYIYKHIILRCTLSSHLKGLRRPHGQTCDFGEMGT